MQNERKATTLQQGTDILLHIISTEQMIGSTELNPDHVNDHSSSRINRANHSRHNQHQIMVSNHMIFPMRNGILKIIPDEYIHRQFGHALDKSPHLYAFSWVLFFTTELLFWQTPLNNNLNKQICTWGYYTIRALPNVYGFAEHITHDCC